MKQFVFINISIVSILLFASCAADAEAPGWLEVTSISPAEHSIISSSSNNNFVVSLTYGMADYAFVVDHSYYITALIRQDGGGLITVASNHIASAQSSSINFTFDIPSTTLASASTPYEVVFWLEVPVENYLVAHTYRLVYYSPSSTN